MSHVTEVLLRYGKAVRPYLEVARLTPSFKLLLPLAPLAGALVMSAGGMPALSTLFGMLLVTLALWGAAWCFNDVMDSHRNETNSSLIRRGTITHQHAIVFCLALLLVSMATIVLFGWRAVIVALVVLFVAATYPLIRRRSYLIDAWFGLGMSGTVTMTYAATSKWPDKTGALFAVVTLLWASGWSVLRAWPHQAEDIGRGVRSLGQMFGPLTGNIIIAMQLSVLFGAWMAGGQARLGTIYTLALIFSAMTIASQAVILQRRKSAGVDLALKMHLIAGATLWLGVVIHFLTAA